MGLGKRAVPAAPSSSIPTTTLYGSIPGMQNVSEASELLMPFDPRRMRCYPVSTRINHVANDDEECSRPIEVAEIQNRLFL